MLYDVNAHEGFNLRRDVYMRLAVFIKHLNKGPVKWQLVKIEFFLRFGFVKVLMLNLYSPQVLPSWNQLPHWRSQRAGNQRQLPWGLFFDLNSLRSYIPVIEAYEFFEGNSQDVCLISVIITENKKKS